MIVAPSLLSADFGHLADDIAMLRRSRAQWLHCDVMDGVFVPNISFGFPVIEAVHKLTDMPLDVHLMIVDPDRYIDTVAKAGAMMMNVHYEACTHLHRTVDAIRRAGMKAAVTLNPATPVELLRDILPDLDMVLLMSVDPGFGGQSFIPRVLDKIRRLRAMIDAEACRTLIEVDGGINRNTGALVAEAGADVIVAGSAVFHASDPVAEIAALAAL